METKALTIGFYNPYFDGLGGGERYTLTLASHWSKAHDVVIFWDDPNIIGQSEKRFGLDLTRVRITPNVFQNGNIFAKLWVSRRYDLIFFLSDGSIPASMAKHNILHFQVPFASVLIDPWKLKQFDSIVCNSQFTRKELDPELGQRAVVIYPPVQHIAGNKTVKRVNRILSVGRFTGYHQTKKQDILIDAFETGYKGGVLKDWTLVLAGGLLPSDKTYYEHLKTRITGLPVTLLPNITNDELVSLYQTSRIYWHAAGYGTTDPTHMEHFGITTAEAMGAGMVPLVYAAGGQLEIVGDGENGFIWNTTEDLMDKTAAIIRDGSLYQRISAAAIKRAADFGTSQFTRAYDALIAGWR